jgi:hypothetical protein
VPVFGPVSACLTTEIGYVIFRAIAMGRWTNMKQIRELCAYWKRVACSGHFGADHKHKWWVVVLFWLAVALVAVALLKFT